MKIVIDASRANKKQKTGVEWYSYHIIQELKKIIPENVKVISASGEKLTDGLENMPKNWQEGVLNWPPKYLWTQIRFWWELTVNPPDVLFVSAHTIPFLPIRKKIKVIITVHDVGFKRFPELYKKIQYWYHHLSMLKIRRRADVILTVSEFSKQEIVDFYKIDPRKITAIPLGFDEDFAIPDSPDENILEKYKIKKPFLLFIGRIEKKKNVLNMIEAFILARAKHPELQLVLVGAPGNEYEKIQEIISKLKLEDKIILPGYVSKEDVAHIMSLSSIFLFVTSYEGFGLPPLQAMACKIPVITSNQRPHNEVAGEAALYANPHRPSEIADRINDILGDENLRDDLIQKGLRRYKEFRWDKTAQGIWEVLSSIVKN